MFSFTYTGFLFLWLLPLLLWYLHRRNPVMPAAFHVSSSPSLPKSWRQHLGIVVFILYFLSLACFIFGLMRPQEKKFQTNKQQGAPLMIVLDRSSSMENSFAGTRETRLKAAKNIFFDFVDANPNSAIGLVSFAKNVYTISPLTFSHTPLRQLIEYLDVAREDEDGTAIGDGISLGAARLVDALLDKEVNLTSGDPSILEEKGGVIVLITDGENNVGRSPLKAAEIAEEWNIRIYAINMATTSALAGLQQAIFGDFKNEVFEKVTQRTGGEFFNAQSQEELQQAYKTITELERPAIEASLEKIQVNERYHLWLTIALISLILAWILKHIVIRRLP